MGARNGSRPFQTACRRVVAPFAVVVTASLLLAGQAGAAQIAGATYTGTHAGGGALSFTVGADGSRLVSHRIEAIPGDTCIYVAQGDAGEWVGAPVLGNVFAYDLHDAFFFTGTFPGEQTAVGTLRLFNRAVAGVKPACDTGVIQWSASTQSVAPPAGQAPAVTPPGTTPRPATRPKRRTYRTTLLVRKPTARRLTARVRSLGAGCARGRTVKLKRGLRTIASATSSASGLVAFKLSASMRGQRVRMTVGAKVGATLACTAGSSKTLKLPRR